MAIRIVSVGKRHDSLFSGAIEDYQKRLRAPFDVSWVFVPPSNLEADTGIADESRRLLERLQPREQVILLDERGTLLDSPAVSHRLVEQFDDGKNVTIIIGGAYGVSEELRRRADFVWSLSPLVFPHQLVRLLLIEQLYRAQAIARDHPYHHS